MGRFSRYPAVNRSIPSVREQKPPVVDAESPDKQVSFAVAPEDVNTTPNLETDNSRSDWPSVDALSEMSIKEVLEWVGDDPDRADYALTAEMSVRGRKTIIKKLSES